jgi:hypothetical protein
MATPRVRGTLFFREGRADGRSARPRRRPDGQKNAEIVVGIRGRSDRECEEGAGRPPRAGDDSGRAPERLLVGAVRPEDAGVHLAPGHLRPPAPARRPDRGQAGDLGGPRPVRLGGRPSDPPPGPDRLGDLTGVTSSSVTALRQLLPAFALPLGAVAAGVRDGGRPRREVGDGRLRVSGAR